MGKFSGLFATPVTAFDKNGAIDPDGIRRVVDFVAGKGVENLFCLGSWGGFALMDSHERMQAAKAYLDAAHANKIPAIINVASTTAKEAIRLASHAEENGAAAVASLVPFYYSSSGYTKTHVLNYFERLVNAVKIPVHFYNNPRTTGYHLDMLLFERLLDTGVAGMKEGGGNVSAFVNMMEIIDRRNVDFDMIPGSVTMFLFGLMYGVKASMIGSAVVFPELARDAWDAWHRHDFAGARDLHALLMKVRRLQSSYGMGSAACYALLAMRGVDIGSPREPWLDLAEDVRDDLRMRFRELRLPV